MMNEQTIQIENLIGEALAAGVTLYEKNGGLAFKQTRDFPPELKAKVVAHKAQIIEYFVTRKQAQQMNQAYTKEQLKPYPRPAKIPLSYAQEGLWFVEQLQGGEQYYMSAVFKMRGYLKVQLFERAIAQVVQRHEILRTRVVVDQQGVPQQIISPDISVPFVAVNISEGKSHVDLEHAQIKEKLLAEAEQLIEGFKKEPLDLEQGPLLRVLLICLDDEYWLTFNMHHIISDGASLLCLVSELETHYSALLEDKAYEGPPLPIQYADYVLWQRQTLNDAYLNSAVAKLRSKLADLDPILSLPTDRPRPSVQSTSGQIYRQMLDGELAQTLLKQVAQHHVTSFMWVLSCFMLFIGRISQNEQVALGTPVLGRNHPELNNLIGLFANTIVIPASLDDESQFSHWLEKQKHTILEAFEYQAVPFDKLVDALGCKRDLSHHPLVQILFTLEQASDSHFVLPNLTIEEVKPKTNHQCAIKCDLELNVQLSEQGILLNWKFDDALYDLDTIVHWADSFAVLLEHVCVYPDTPCVHIPLLDEQQTLQILKQPQCTQVQWPSDTHLVEIFERQVTRYPEQIALVDENSTLTYQALNYRANQLAHLLIDHGVKAEQLIPVSVTRNVDMVVTLLAILKAGCAYVPIDPDYPADRIEYIIKDVGGDVLICDSTSAAVFDFFGMQVINISEAETSSIHNGNANLRMPISGKNLAYMIYTSGTTGRPKGVQIEHRHVVRLLFTNPNLFDFNEHDVWTLFHSFCFDFSVWEMYGALLFGGRLVVVSKEACKDSEAFAKLLIEQKVTVLNQTPSAFYVLQDNMLKLDRALQAKNRIRYVIFGGEALQPAKLKPWALQFTDSKLINMYGITETTVHVTYKQITHKDIEQGTSNIGKPIPTTSCYVLDKHLQPLPYGAIGELYVGGEGVCRGYWQKEDLNKQRFITNPYSEHASRLYKTGDLARSLCNGELVYVGRIDDQVKVRGYRIELGEIENQLRTHPWLLEVVTLLKQDEALGSSICAFVVLAKEAHFEDLTAQIQHYLRQTLPEFMLPTSITSVASMPLTSNGKVDKKALLALATSTPQPQPFNAPNTEFERQIADCFAQILQLDSVGRDDHFFRLGGHSLLATQAITQLREKAKLNVTLKDLFQRPEVKSLAQIAQHNHHYIGQTSEQLKLTSREHHGDIPLSFAQQRLWSIDQIQQGSLEYHMSAAFELCGQLNIDAFTQSWYSIVERHEVLRTCFVCSKQGQPYQQIKQSYDELVNYVDANELTNEQQERLWLKILRDDRQTPFKLNQDIMLRVTLLKLGVDKHRLLVNMHHIASDAQSLHILVKEFTQFYQSYAFKHALPEGLRTPLSVQYRDYAIWQRDVMNAEKLHEHAQFWLSHLDGAPPLHHLPVDSPRAKQQITKAKLYQLQFSKQLGAAIRAHCQRLDITLFTWLHTAFSLTVARFSNSHDVVIGAPFSGRNHTQLEHMIGFFVNTLPIRTVLTDDISFESLLAQQKDLLEDIHMHKEMPFEQIIERLKLTRDLSHQSVFQLTFSLNPQIESELKLPGIHAEAIDEHALNVKFDIELSCHEDDAQLRFNWVYNSALFDEQTIESLASTFKVLVEQVIEQPATAVSTLPLLTKCQSQQLVIQGRHTDEAYSRTVLDEFIEMASADKERTALIDSDTNQHVSYKWLHQRSNELAQYLIAKGVKHEQCIVVSMPFGSDLIVAMLGILKAGGCYVPVDPNYPQHRINFISEDCSAAFVITRSDHIDKFNVLANVASRIICIDDYYTEQDIINHVHSEHCLPLINSQQLAYVIYTSGTTGNPKGVMIPHCGLMNLCNWHNRSFNVNDHSVASQTANIAFDAAAWEIWPYLCAGSAIITVPKPILNAPDKLAQLFTHYKVTHCFLATPIAEAILADDAFTPQYLTYLLVGGDKLNRIDVSSLPFSIINNYGPTEASVVTTSGVVTLSNKVPDIGEPIDNTYLYILDKNKQPVPAGMIGELYIAGLGLARGYLNLAELTQKRFVMLDTPTGQHVRAYQSGDLVRLNENGKIAYISRLDNQVKLRGYRIELGEIEQVLLSCLELDECVVQLCSLASGVKQLVAFLCFDAALFTKERVVQVVQSHLSAKLPAYMHPSHYIALESLPLTPHGKVDHHALNDLVSTLNPQIRDELQTVDKHHNSETLEGKLLNLYHNVLNTKHLRLDDDFFAFGGDSILSIQIASRSRALGIEISVADVFNYNTVGRLAEHIKGSQIASSSADAVSSHSGPIAPLPIQKWFFEQAFEKPTHWNQALLLSTDKLLGVGHMQLALDSIIELHDALRLTVNSHNELAVQARVHSHEIWQGSDLRESRQWQCDLLQIANKAQQSFEFINKPLFRVCFFKTPQDESHNRLLIVAHHLIIDGVSWRLLLEDFQHACERAVDDQQIVLPKRTASLYQVSQFYLDLAQQQDFLGHWQSLVERGADSVSMLQLRKLTDGETPKATTYKHVCSEQLTDVLVQDANMAYNTSVQVLLLSALQWCAMVHYQTRSQIIMLEGHGREMLNKAVKAERCIGWLTAMYPFHLFSNAASLHEVICTVKEQLAYVTDIASSYGALRYGHQSQDIRQSLHINSQDKIFFNYLGQLDNAINNDALIAGANEEVGALHSDRNHLYYGLQITAAINNGRLSFNFDYDANRLDSADIEKLATHLEESLKAVVAHCSNTQLRQYTPSDFNLLAGVSRLQLDKLIAPYNHQIIADIYPLSMLQKGMWLVSQRNAFSKDVPYLEQVSMVFDGAFDVEAFSYAWQCLLKTHSILRTAFIKATDEPLQVVIESVELPLQIDDSELFLLSGMAEHEYLKTLAELEYSEGIDLTVAPCMRLRLVPLLGNRYGFIWTYHHLIMDGWSQPTLFANLLSYYSARIGGQTVKIKEDKFKDYIAYLQKQNGSAEQAFWQSYLSGVDEPTLLVKHITCDHTLDERKVAQIDIAIDSQLRSQLNQFAKAQGFTLNHILQGVWGYWLSICCDSDYALFGQTISGRPSDLTDVEQRVGLYINTQAVKLDVDINDSALVYLNRVKQNHLQLATYCHSALTQVHDWSNIDNGSELFDALYVFENYPTAPLDNADEVPFEVQSQQFVDHTHYPLTLVIGDSERLTLSLCYDLSLFTHKVVEQSLETLCHLLRLFVTQPDVPLCKLPLLADEQLHQSTLDTFNTTLLSNEIVSFEQTDSLVQRFEQMVALYPNKPALQFYNSHDCIEMNYAQLNERAEKLASYIHQQLGQYAQQPIIAICLDKRFELVISVVACLKLGAAYLAISPQLPHARRHYMADNAGIAALITIDRDWQGKLPAAKIIDLNTLSSNVPDLPIPNIDSRGDNLCYVIYTSGTTGTPKGVMVEQSSVLNYVAFLSKCYGITHTDNYLQFASCSFDVFAEEVFCSLLNGATLVMADTNQLLTARGLATVSSKCSLTLMSLPTAYWHMLAKERVDLGAQLRLITIGGEQMQTGALNVWQQHYGESIRLINAYGPTEATISATLKDVTHLHNERLSIGLPVAGATLAIFDKHGRVLPEYMVGELYISGVCLARGYLADKAKTDSVFIYDKANGQRWYKTGDRVRINANAEVEYLGRLDEQVKVRGYRIELAEIERNLLLNKHIAQCAVVIRQDSNGANQLVAFLISCIANISLSDVRQALSERLPQYMLPEHFKLLDSLPLTNNGKVDKKQLAALAQNINRKQRRSESEHKTPLQRALSARLEELLNVENINMHEDIFMLGAHSLIAMRLIGELSDELDLDLPIELIFENRTIATLSNALQKRIRRTSVALEDKAVLCLQTGQQGYTPIILIAGAGGLLMAFQSLVQGLDERIPVYGLQPDKIVDEDKTINSVTLTASHYLSELEKAGVCNAHIIGHSFGSFIGYEIVRQAAQKAAQFELSLTVIDTPLPVTVHTPINDEQCSQLMVDNILEFFYISLSDTQQQDYSALKPEQRLRWIFKVINAAGYHFSISQLSRFAKVFAAQLNAPVQLQPIEATSATAVIKATQTSHFEGQDIKPDMGWSILCGAVETYEVEGNHLSILQKSHVAAVVKILEKNYVLN
ncbi:amino acid adenylation domain-containing protein [Pseudoalteromonas sp. JBTF-M23]|uniref:Amino acid adenylation domain-containing protein n=1 Tax=Pseudoalteromonas caenipelagi TaxID=2726988 RepID=A0A849V8J1_9GAMM|nr:non-ribosomal peptide synthetase [Pseudoalteromonas caenipelagi]NOU49090.1 amino acid adenylation domain-containing protein [Pseudoalteromonas caenipelagi]